MMPRREPDQDWHELVKIPAVDHEDHLFANLTVRQVAQLAAVVAVGWLAYQGSRPFVPPQLFAVAALPVGAVAVAVVLTRRDGLPLDRWLLAAWRHRRIAHHLVPTGPGGPSRQLLEDLTGTGLTALPVPARGIATDGTVDLGEQGCAVVSTAGTVNFALRTSGEQRMLIGGFGRWLNALAAPVQILVRTHRLDLAPMVARLCDLAPALAHPLLEDAALAHAEFLADLGQGRDLLARQVLVVHREPGADRAAVQRAQRRAAESASLLGACEVQAVALEAAVAFAVLASASDPASPPHSDPACPDIPVTARTGGLA